MILKTNLLSDFSDTTPPQKKYMDLLKPLFWNMYLLPNMADFRVIKFPVLFFTWKLKPPQRQGLHTSQPECFSIMRLRERMKIRYRGGWGKIGGVGEALQVMVPEIFVFPVPKKTQNCFEQSISICIRS